MIKAGIFDVGNVLIHWEGKFLQDDIKQTLNISDIAFQEAWTTLLPLYELGEISEEIFWQRFLKETRSDQSLPDESLFIRQFKRRFSPYQEILDLASLLKKQGLKIAVLSNTLDQHAKFLLEKGVYDQFDVVVLSHEVGISKPDPRIYHLTLEKLGVKPDEAFFIDDLKENVDAANKVGVHGILIKDAEQVKKDIEKLGVRL